MAARTIWRRLFPLSPRVIVVCEPPLYGQFLMGNFRTADYRTSCTYMGKWVIMRPFTHGGSNGGVEHSGRSDRRSRA
jgi:hypothetical protein